MNFDVQKEGFRLARVHPNGLELWLVVATLAHIRKRKVHPKTQGLGRKQSVWL